MTWLQWTICSLLVLLGSGVIVGNWAIVAQWSITRRSGSLILVIGGLTVAIAFALGPWEQLSSWWWLPLVVDLGCLPMLLLTGGYLAWLWLSGQWR